MNAPATHDPEIAVQDVGTDHEASLREIDACFAQFDESDAKRWDLESAIPREVLSTLAAAGLLGCGVAREYGGRGWSARSHGYLFCRAGELSLSLLSILTVHSMVIEAVRLWGSDEQRQRWLPKLVAGDALGAFGLTEPSHGSDAMNIRTQFLADGDGYRVSGCKKWISFGCGADVLLTFGQTESGATLAALVPTSDPGFTATPMRNLLGFRGAMLGEITLEDCAVPRENLLGSAGGGVPYVAGGALDLGRLAIAYGCLGAMESCTEDAIQHARERVQFDEPLAKHQLIQRILSDMITSVKVARRLCDHAAQLRDEGDPRATLETTIAKYVASTHSVRVASDAVQVLGAAGCSADESRVERFYRDTRITEIIEGSNQMQQLMIAQNGMSEFQRRARAKAKQRESR